MQKTSLWQLPFFETRHAELSRNLETWLGMQGMRLPAEEPVDEACRARVRLLGAGGWLRHCVPQRFGKVVVPVESRALCILRQTLAWHDGLFDFAFAMQGLGSGAIALHGTPELQQHYLPKVASGEWIAAFALSEPDAGSDVAAMSCTATLEREHYVLDGMKTWISNGGIADFYTVVARTGEAPGAKGLSAFVVDANNPGLQIVERLEVMAPHPLARLRFRECKVPISHRLGAPGEGFKIAMRTLDIFRTSVAAAAIGFGTRALHEATQHAKQRVMFGKTLADLQLTQAALADMATLMDSAELLTYRAAWRRDVVGESITKEAAMAKMVATENAQQVIDRALQMFGGRGVQSGERVEKLYREIRPLRIYEGATEVQKLIIAKEILKAASAQG